MLRYSGSLCSFVIIALCIGINISRYPVVWEMLDKTTASVAAVAPDDDVSSRPQEEGFSIDDLPNSHQLAENVGTDSQNERILREGSPVPPPLGGSPSSSPSSRITLFATETGKKPAATSSNGYGPIPAQSLPLRKTAAQPTPQPTPQPIAEPDDFAEEPEPQFAEDEPVEVKTPETETRDPQMSRPQPVYGQQYAPIPAKKPEPVSVQTPKANAVTPREMSPEEKVEAFRKTPLILDTPQTDEFTETPEW